MSVTPRRKIFFIKISRVYVNKRKRNTIYIYDGQAINHMKLSNANTVLGCLSGLAASCDKNWNLHEKRNIR